MQTPLMRSDLYTMTKQLLLGLAIDDTLFDTLLGLAQGNIETNRPWTILRTEDATHVASPVSNSYANSLYLTPFDLGSDFVMWYSPKRSIVLVASDGITFRWYSEVPMERKHEYKDDDSKFYVDYKNSQAFLMGTLDRQYTIHQFYVSGSDTITDTNAWIFPAQFHPILAFMVAKMYRQMFDYDTTNVQQGEMIEKSIQLIQKQMNNWDSSFQESMIEGVDYPMENNRPGFLAGVVGDNEG